MLIMQPYIKSHRHNIMSKLWARIARLHHKNQIPFPMTHICLTYWSLFPITTGWDQWNRLIQRWTYIKRVRIASIGKISQAYPGQHKSYLRATNKNKTNWNTLVTIYINRYNQYIILHNKENLFSILLNLQANPFRINVPKWTDIQGASGKRHKQKKSWESLKPVGQQFQTVRNATQVHLNYFISVFSLCCTE